MELMVSLVKKVKEKYQYADNKYWIYQTCKYRFDFLI